ASGQFPIECIRTMHEIVIEVEKNPTLYNHLEFDAEAREIPDCIAASSVLAASMVEASAIVCLTTTGKTATLISSYRPEAKLYAATQVHETLNRILLAWGIHSFALKPYKSSEEAFLQMETLLLRNGLIRKGDTIVFTLGSPVKENAKTNALKIHKVTLDVPPCESTKLPLRCQWPAD
ncbi:MAG: pyruvate kinase, partial [Bdellovibrionales bacterium]|nr:pyruvate kinase [Bdellovibrionales bacterium]